MSREVSCKVVEFCSAVATIQGFCGGHYSQQLRGETLRPLRGSPEYYAAKLNADGEKQCTRCGYWLPQSEFYSRNDAGRNNKLRAHCNRCNILRRMNITARDYDRILEEQGGGCKMCGSKENSSKGKRFAVDHDHACCPGSGSCGKCIRAILCDDCNQILGRAKDSPEILQAGIDLLKAGACPVK